MTSERNHQALRPAKPKFCVVPGKAPRLFALWLGMLVFSTLSCAGRSWQLTPHDTLYQHAPAPIAHSEPAEIKPTEWVPVFWFSSFAQFSRGLSPGYHLQKVVDGPPALDVNTFGKVPDSSWFENRIGKRHMSVEELRRGPNKNPPPNVTKLVVESGKTGGVTPGFIVKDADDVRWVVKFDHPAFPELASGAEVVSTKLLHAVGYHVPENHAVSFDIANLSLAPNATTRDRYNRKVVFRWQELREALQLLNPGPDGRVRALFSRFLPGKPVGPAPMHGTRLDDPNDRIPHERRRSLRGLWVFYAWLNNTDAKYSNTLDMFETTDEKAGRGHITHYLIDFGTSLGATPVGPKPRYEGYEYTVDWAAMGQRLATLGIQYPYWATVRRSPFRSTGHYEARVFDPERWKPKYPNPVFEAADAEDTFWAASILAHVGVLEVAAAVSTAEYYEPGADEWITETLLLRRNKILRYAFSNFAPLDDPKVDEHNKLSLTDLEVLAGLRRQQTVSYEWQVFWHEVSNHVRKVSLGRSKTPSVQLGPVVDALGRQVDLHEAPFFTVRWRRIPDESGAGPEVLVHLRLLPNGALVPVGLEREER